jgi:hypothetical protein
MSHQFADRPGKYPFHHIVHDYEPFTSEERAKLRADLQVHGFDPRHPIWIWRGQIVEGFHRETEARNLELERAHYEDLGDISEEEMRTMVVRANEHRRSNTERRTRDQKRADVDLEITADPNRSDRAIAKRAGVDHKTVAARRVAIASCGEFPTLPTASKGGPFMPTDKIAEHTPPDTPASVTVPPQQRKDTRGRVGGGQHARPITKPKASPASKACILNSLTWADATPEQRAEFVRDIGLDALLTAASEPALEHARKRLVPGIDDLCNIKAGAEIVDREVRKLWEAMQSHADHIDIDAWPKELRRPVAALVMLMLDVTIEDLKDVSLRSSIEQSESRDSPSGRTPNNSVNGHAGEGGHASWCSPRSAITASAIQTTEHLSLAQQGNNRT